MAHQTNTFDNARPSLSDRLGALLAHFRVQAARRRIYHETLRELNNLSERDLADLGLHRSEIRRVAWQAAYKD